MDLIRALQERFCSDFSILQEMLQGTEVGGRTQLFPTLGL